MIRKIIVPTQNTYLLHIPDDLVGKHVEVIAFSTDDVENDVVKPAKTDKIKLSDKYRNVFTNEDAASFDRHTQTIRKEWDNT